MTADANDSTDGECNREQEAIGQSVPEPKNDAVTGMLRARGSVEIGAGCPISTPDPESQRQETEWPDRPLAADIDTRSQPGGGEE